MLAAAPETAYDLRFRLLGVPVRVHPLFWLVAVFLSGRSDDLSYAAVFVVCAFLSILLHELGHGLAGRLVGYEPTGITLYTMGGYCSFSNEYQTPGRRLFILFCGPATNFGLAALAAFLRYRLASETGVVGALGDSNTLNTALGCMLAINLIWGIFNLLPIWPLDGGRIVETLLSVHNPAQGARRGHIVSLLTAALVAYGWFSIGSPINALLTGYLGYLNYQMLQFYHNQYMFSQDRGGW